MAYRHRFIASMLLGKFTARKQCVGQVSFFTTSRAATACTSDNTTTPSLLSLVRDNKTWFLSPMADSLLRKKNIYHIPRQEWVQVCHELDLDTTSAELPNGNTDCGKLRNKVKQVQHVCIQSHPDHQEQYKDRRAKASLSPDEVDMYDAHTLVELRMICQRYGIIMKDKKTKEQLVKAIFQKKQSVTPQEEEVLNTYEKDLLHYCRELGFARDIGTRCKLTLARKLIRVQHMTHLIDDKLLQMHPNDTAARTLDMDNLSCLEESTDWKEQLSFYRDRERQKRIFQKLGMEYNSKLKCVAFLRQVCRKLKITLPKNPSLKPIMDKPRKKGRQHQRRQ